MDEDYANALAQAGDGQGFEVYNQGFAQLGIRTGHHPQLQLGQK